jgi:decaprenylphospho-beta-D-ribofuranose 2-oxidase
MQTAVRVDDEELTGWGLHDRARCRVARPRSVEEVAELFAKAGAAGESIALRGAGCSYGDAALNQGHVVLDCRQLNRILDWDAESGRAVVEPGVTVDQLWRHMLLDGWWPAVVPGTSAATIGGVAAANVHGKNNWQVGSFGEHVVSFDLLLPSGETVTCSREQNQDLFFGAIGGMGLLGCLTRLTLQARRVYSGQVWEITSVHHSLAELLAGLEEATGWANDLVAWIDTSARGWRLGRGLLKASRDLKPDEDAYPTRSFLRAAQRRDGGLAARVPQDWLPRLGRAFTSPLGVWVANRGQWWRGQSLTQRRPHLTTYPAANFPLDAVPEWRSVYLPGGLIQHQSFVPAELAEGVFGQILERSYSAGHVPTFAVLKKHRASPFVLSCLPDGYSLALDYPVRQGEEARLLALLGGLNDLVAEAGGRCYFAKDSTATAEQVRRMYPQDQLDKFAALKRQYDPQALLSSNLYRRALQPGE